MSVKPIHRKPSAKAAFGNPPESEWHKGQEEDRYPKPDVELGPRTPGWTTDIILEYQQKAKQRAAQGREQRAEHGRELRRKRDKSETTQAEI